MRTARFLTEKIILSKNKVDILYIEFSIPQCLSAQWGADFLCSVVNTCIPYSLSTDFHSLPYFSFFVRIGKLFVIKYLKSSGKYKELFLFLQVYYDTIYL